MTPREALAQVEGLGCRLSLRPGGLCLTGRGEPPPEVLALIREHRRGLVELLEEETRAWAAHEASLVAGRVTTFPPHLLDLIHPSLRGRLAVEMPRVSRTLMEHRSPPEFDEGSV